MLSLGFHRKYHSLFDHHIARAAQYWLLLMKPGAHAVAYQSSRIIDPTLAEFVEYEVVNFTSGDTRPAFFDSLAMNIQRNLIPTFLFIVW